MHSHVPVDEGFGGVVGGRPRHAAPRRSGAQGAAPLEGTVERLAAVTLHRSDAVEGDDREKERINCRGRYSKRERAAPLESAP